VKGDRLALKTVLKLKGGVRATVSTVDLGIEHDWGGEPGYYYETAVFLAVEDGYVLIEDDSPIVARYKTRREAEEGHRRIVEALERGNVLQFWKDCRTIVRLDLDALEKMLQGDTNV